MLNISGSWLEILFFSKFNIFVGMLLGPTDFFESKEDIMFCISDLFLGLRKKQFWVLFFCNSEKCLREGLIFSFAFSAIVAKHKYQHKHNLFLSVTIELHKCDKNGTATLKAHWQISNIWCFKKYCLCDKACQFSALWGTSRWSYLENLTNDNKFINTQVRLFIYPTMCQEGCQKSRSVYFFKKM